jgi:nitrogen fixation-related uncharacterized protein
MSFAQGLLVLTVICDVIIVWAFLWAIDLDLRREEEKK